MSFKTDLDRFGLLRASYAKVMHTLRPVLFLAQVTTRNLHREEDPNSPYPIRAATREEVMTALPDFGNVVSKSEIEASFTRGDLCCGAFDGDRLIAFTWRNYTGAPHEGNIWVAFDPPYRYGYRAYTLPAYRGQRAINPRITDGMCRARGCTHTIAFIETHNFASKRSSARNGNRFVGYAGYLRLWGSVITFRTPGAAKHTFRFVVRSRSN